MASPSDRPPFLAGERIWSPRQMSVAAFLGSPLAAAWFFSRNYLAFGDEVRSRRSLWLGLAFTALLVAVAFVVPPWFPTALVPALYTAGIEVYGSYCFKTVYEEHIAEGWAKGSWWSVVGIALASCVIVIALGAMFVFLAAWWTGAQVDWDPRSRSVSSIQVTVADIPHVLAKVSTATRTPAFAAFVFTTPDRPNQRDAVNLQFSLENGRAGFDWVLRARRNVEDKASFVGFVTRRGYSFSERTLNGVPYLRIEDGDLAQLCADVVTKLYARPRSEPMGLIVEGFEWDR